MVSKRLEELEKLGREISGAPPVAPKEAEAEPAPISTPMPSPVRETEEPPPAAAAAAQSLRETQSHALSRAAKPTSGFANRHKPRKVACFHCDGSLEVSYAAKMATCPECKEPINLNDYEVNKPLNEDIFTRGNVTINNLGSLECENLVCHNLKAYGPVQALIHATGDVMIRSRAKLPGGLRCEQLLVGRDAVVDVEGDVYVEGMEVDGVISADAFTSVGTTKIDEHGAINGPLKTRAVSMENGGALNGALQIVSPRPKTKS